MRHSPLTAATHLRMDPLLIVGTGALATLFAARLSGAGYSVLMLGTWKAGLDTLRRDGVRLIAASGEERRYPVGVIEDPREGHNLRHALVLVKAWQTEQAARRLQECLDGDGTALTLQNGLGNREALAGQLGPARVALGATTAGATLLGPGLVKEGGAGAVFLEQNLRLAPLVKAIESAGFPVEVVEDARSLVWGKLVISAAINPLTAILRVPNGKLLELPEARDLLKALALEAARVAEAEDIQLPFPDPIAAAEDVALRTAGNHSSMLQDVLRGAPTEIDAICGAIVRTGQRHGIDTPANWICWKMVQALTNHAIPGRF